MMMSPLSYRIGIENYTIEQLKEEKIELKKSIFSHTLYILMPKKSRIVMHPSPAVKRSSEKSYLKEVKSLIKEKRKGN
ncbi:MAG: hypothetical protein R3Y21_02170 [Mycoplasmatota bacterium]